jgi:hypothetical protein
MGVNTAPFKKYLQGVGNAARLQETAGIRSFSPVPEGSPEKLKKPIFGIREVFYQKNIIY